MQGNKNERLLEFQAAVEEAYPEIFHKTKPKPLSIGIHTQLHAAVPDTSMTIVRYFLRRWTRRPAYHRSVAKGGNRFNLNGQPDTEISEEHQKLAAETVEKRQAREQQRGPTRTKNGQNTSRSPRSNSAPAPRGAKRGPAVIRFKKRRNVATVAKQAGS